MLHFLFSRLLHYLFWIRYNVNWNVNVVINEAMKENINCIDKFITQDRSCLERLRRLSLFLCQKTTFEWLKKSSHCPSFATFDGQTFFSHVICFSWNGLCKTWNGLCKIKWSDFLSASQKIWIILFYWQLVGEHKVNIIDMN